MPYKVLVHGQRYLLALRNSRKNLSTKLFPEHFLPIQKKPAHRVSSIPVVLNDIVSFFIQRSFKKFYKKDENNQSLCHQEMIE